MQKGTELWMRKKNSNESSEFLGEIINGYWQVTTGESLNNGEALCVDREAR